jgi:hypothetical protein
MSIANDGEKRRPLPELYEISYWRSRLFEHMRKSPAFNQAIEHLRGVYAAHLIDVAERDEMEEGLDIGDVIHLSYADLVESDLFSFLNGEHVRGRDQFTSMDPMYPDAVYDMLRRFGLMLEGRPAGRAIRYVHNMVINLEQLNAPFLLMRTAWERWLRIHVSPEGAWLEIRRNLDMNEPALSHDDVSPHQPYRFDEWDELKQAALKAAAQAVDHLREGYHARYRPRRNPSAEPAREQLCENIARQLTGRYPGTIHRNDRARFCKLIHLDNPGAPKSI